MWNHSALFPTLLRVFSLSTKQELLILKRTSVARSQKSKSWCVSCNLISNKTSDKTSIPCSIIYNATKISYKMITLTWYKSFKLNIINIFHIYSFSGKVKSIINLKERCRFENTFRIELFVKFKFWLIGKTIIFIIKIIINNLNHKRIMKKTYNKFIEWTFGIIEILLYIPLVTVILTMKVVVKIARAIIFVVNEVFTAITRITEGLEERLSVKD